MEAIPTPLREVKRWVCWRFKDGRKPPVIPETGEPNKDWNTEGAWLTFDDAVEAYSKHDHIDGVGFVMGDGWGGLDLDKCRDIPTGKIDPRAEAVIEMSGGYAEISPSGAGVKIFGRADNPAWLELTFSAKHVIVDPKKQGYFAVTGTAVGEGSALAELPLEAIAKHFGAEDLTEREKPRRKLEAILAPGTQNTQLFKEACAQARGGKSETEIFALLRAIVDERVMNEPGREPWDDASIRAIARSASRYSPSEDIFPQTETGDAEFFAQKHDGIVIHDHRRGKWLVWDGHRWCPDQTGHVYNFAIESMRSRRIAAAQVEDPKDAERRVKWATGGESSSRLDHLLKIAKGLPTLARTGDEFDTNPMLLGVPNGVVDLTQGILRHAKPDDMISLQTLVPYNPDAKCPLWEKTVEEIFVHNLELIPYFQRALGYSLTGDVREEIFFILEGTGRNGKGTLINTFAAVMGDYSDNLSFHSLERQDGSQATNDIAKLVHKRLVTASESSDGKRINDQRIKGLTGRDPITARFLYREEFTFFPEFKLFLSVNELPKVTDNSIGFWERPHTIPFRSTFKDNPDRTLKDRLIEEAEGILAWAVRGCLAWQNAGLNPPRTVVARKEEYRLSQEPLAQWYEDECRMTGNRDDRAKVADAFDSYNRWFDRNRFRFRRLGRNQFAKEIEKRCEIKMVHKTKHALGLIVDEHDNEYGL